MNSNETTSVLHVRAMPVPLSHARLLRDCGTYRFTLPSTVSARLIRRQYRWMRRANEISPQVCRATIINLISSALPLDGRNLLIKEEPDERRTA